MKIFLTIGAIVAFSLLGVHFMAASEQSLRNQWISFQDSLEHFKVDFPHQPVHMEFDLTKDDALRGHLTVYTTALNQGVLMVSVLTSDSLKEQPLESQFFQNIFYSCFVRRLFYHPKAIKKASISQMEKIEVQGLPALNFSLSYKDNHEDRKIKGVAILKETKLYVVLYIASEAPTKSNFFQHFIQSFYIER